MKVSQIMKKAYVIDSSITIKEAAKIMSHKKIGGLLVIKNNKIVGIVTERDIISNMAKSNSQVSDIMNKGIISVSSDTEIDDVAKLMCENKIKRIPIIDNGKLLGLVRITDILGKTNSVEEGEFFFS
ncbi:CBS domain-containing protein [Candidatus Pacearchaeota archaeon]|nr:CBS domain-containing protein [Candidatus Pacearchaeota archaeon]